jgi:sigma-B regulation protein RsbU (phosphoserine phosphatase)
MLPNVFPAFPERDDFDIYASMTPAKEVGGDFYDFFLVDESHLGLVMADVSGKGVPAALFMMIAKMMIQNYAMTGRSPAAVLERVNEQICANNREEMFVTVWLGILDLSNGHLTAANAGHEYPVLKRPDGQFEVIKDKHGFVIGGMDGVRYKEYSLQMDPGSKLFLYTDGVPEATNAENELFGMERAVDALNADADRNPQELLHGVTEAVAAFVGDAPQFDDLTMLSLVYFGKKGGPEVLTFDAVVDNIPVVTDFINERLEALDCPMKAQMQIDVAIDEIFANIASYAYPNGTGSATVKYEVLEDPHGVSITFVDSGIPFNPLEREDPDTTLPAEEREIGGLGIFMVRKSMDDVRYQYENGQNVLTIIKYF